MEIARQAGVEFTSCVSCAINLGLVETLEKEVNASAGVKTVSLLMQNGKHVLTIGRSNMDNLKNNGLLVAIIMLAVLFPFASVPSYAKSITVKPRGKVNCETLWL